ncbi:MAG: pYEATS domain-containing protein [Methylobacter sp.]
MDQLRKVLFLALAFGCLILGTLRAFGFGTIDIQVLWFFALAGVLLVIDRVKEFAIGSDGFSAKLNELQEQLREVENIAVDAAQTPSSRASNYTFQQTTSSWDISGSALPPITVSDDPQKGRFGGSSEVNNRKISADVRQSGNSSRFFDIFLRVESTATSNPLAGDVIFYLHDTFRSPVRVVKPSNGIAELQLLAYGAFTVGVVVDDGKTLLELDLAQDIRFPKRFRES